MSIENIQFLITKLNQEHTSHLQIKTKLSKEITELTKKELELRKTYTEFQTAILNMNKSPVISAEEVNISQLVITFNDLENEILQNQQHSIAVETELTHERIQIEMIKNKIDVLNSEKEELEATNKQKKQEQLHNKSDSRKVQDKRERLVKLRRQIEKQERIKQNLSNFIYVSNLIEQAIQNYSMTNQEKVSELEEVTPEILEIIIEAKEAFQEAQDKFSANNLTPFLKEAYRAFRLGLKSVIFLSEGIMDELADQPLSDQVFALVNKGLTLNTSHLTAVESMLQKIDKGVEIAPLASFANEIQEYFIENLSLLRINSAKND